MVDFREVWVEEVPKHKPRLLIMNKYVLILPRLVIWRGPRDLSSEICVAGVSERFPEGCLGFVWGLSGGVWGLSGPRLCGI